MAPINKGNTLLTEVLQPGYTVRNDGYGLWTGRCVFKADKSMTGASLPVARGDAHPDATYSAFMFADKIEVLHGANNIITISVDYVGISLDGYAQSTTTDCNVSGAVSTTTEPIETHPNFFEATVGPSNIAGLGIGSIGAPIYEASTLKSKLGDTATLYKGARGAHFTQRTGGQFVGFIDPAFKEYYGRKSYLAAQTGFSGVIYTNSTSIITAFRQSVGRSSKDNTWDSELPNLIPSYVGATFLSPPTTNYPSGLPQLLLASVNFEDFGLDTYKVNYTIRYNAEGYVTEVYPPYY